MIENNNMWPVILGAGTVALLIKALPDELHDSKRDIKKESL